MLSSAKSLIGIPGHGLGCWSFLILFDLAQSEKVGAGTARNENKTWLMHFGRRTEKGRWSPTLEIYGCEEEPETVMVNPTG